MMKYLLLHKPHIDCKLLTNIQCFELQNIKEKRLSDYVDIHYLPQTHPIPKAEDNCYTPEHFPNGTSFALDYKCQKPNFSFLKTQLFLEYTDIIVTDY